MSVRKNWWRRCIQLHCIAIWKFFFSALLIFRIFLHDQLETTNSQSYLFSNVMVDGRALDSFNGAVIFSAFRREKFLITPGYFFLKMIWEQGGRQKQLTSHDLQSRKSKCCDWCMYGCMYRMSMKRRGWFRKNFDETRRISKLLVGKNPIVSSVNRFSRGKLEVSNIVFERENPDHSFRSVYYRDLGEDHSWINALTEFHLNYFS